MTTQELLSAAKAGVPVLSRATEAQKNSALRSMANALEARADAILAANRLDLEAAKGPHLHGDAGSAGPESPADL